MSKRHIELVKVYTESDDGLKVFNCGRDILTGKYYSISVDFISDLYDHDTFNAQATYLLMGLFSAFSSEEGYDSLAELIADCESKGLFSGSNLTSNAVEE